ncbi:MAG: response regulator [Hahellaceae bacterium]|nr:response regulator [Hahellaceae bacterium]
MNDTQKTYRVLAVDDEPGILSALQRQLRKTAFEWVTVDSGKEALTLLANERFQLIISDMRMPEMDGAEFLGRVKAEWPDTVRILLTGYSEMEATVKAINDGGIFSYLSKPWEREELLALLERAAQHYQLHRNRQVRLVKANRKAQALEDSHKALSQKLAESEDAVARSKAFVDMARQEIELAYDTAVEVFANLIDLKTPGETGINREVAQCAQFLATVMGLPPTEQRNVRLAGMLYNVGKIGLPAALITQPEQQLNDNELKQFRRYPKLGESALLALTPLNQVTQLIALHRECLNGSGFPMGLSQTALPPGARILSVSVCFRE